MMSNEAPWMTLAWRELGEHETAGHVADNPKIIQWLGDTHITDAHDEIPWCAAFVNAMLKAAGQGVLGSPRARAWAAWGRAADAPRYGDVVVLSRGSDTSKGHVGFFIDRDLTTVWLLGGNQGNAVSVGRFPAARVVACRAPLPATRTTPPVT